MIAPAPQTQTLYYVAFIDRGDARRVISLRRATRREVKHYVESYSLSRRSGKNRDAAHCRGRQIIAAAKADPNAQQVTPKQLKAMVPIQVFRGRPKSDAKKQLVSVRYSPEVLEYFRSTGDGWQSRMDGVLRQYVARQSR